MALGILDDADYEEHTCGPLRPGQILVVGTDGIWEMPNAAEEQYGKARLREVIRGAATGTAEDISRAIRDSLHEFRGDCRPADDVTFVVLKVVVDDAGGVEHRPVGRRAPGRSRHAPRRPAPCRGPPDHATDRQTDTIGPDNPLPPGTRIRDRFAAVQALLAREIDFHRLARSAGLDPVTCRAEHPCDARQQGDEPLLAAAAGTTVAEVRRLGKRMLGHGDPRDVLAAKASVFALLGLSPLEA